MNSAVKKVLFRLEQDGNRLPTGLGRGPVAAVEGGYAVDNIPSMSTACPG